MYFSGYEWFPNWDEATQSSAEEAQGHCKAILRTGKGYPKASRVYRLCTDIKRWGFSKVDLQGDADTLQKFWSPGILVYIIRRILRKMLVCILGNILWAAMRWSM